VAGFKKRYGNIHINMVDLTVEFEWDLAKDMINRRKHGCSFLEATETFKDPMGLQVVDRMHSENEQRSYWIGRSSAGRILTTWFTVRGTTIRIIGCADWRKFRKLYETAQIK
jgi:uncharacterized DUF497 family protein